MAERKWDTIKVRYCEHAGSEVGLEVDTVYPAEHLPDQPPRILSQRCSNAVRCMITNDGTCVWAGGNPAYDPFIEKD